MSNTAKVVRNSSSFSLGNLGGNSGGLPPLTFKPLGDNEGDGDDEGEEDDVDVGDGCLPPSWLK